jgi:Tetratricopeptide repeat
MSIIYGTLARLETDAPLPAYCQEKASTLRQSVDRGGFPVKTVATIMMFVIAATSMMLWHRNNEVVGYPHLAPAAATYKSVVTENAEYQLSAVSVAKRRDTPIEATDVTAQAPGGLDTVPVEPVSTGMVAAAGNTLPNEREGPATPDAIKEPLKVVDAGIHEVSKPVNKPGAVPTERYEPQQISPVETDQQGLLEQAIEQARRALSRASYQQALSALQSLDPAPENRADFWLIKGSAHLGMGQLDLAEVAFASAQGLAPDNAQIAVQLAILKQEKGDHAGALQILESEAVRHPNLPEIHLNKGYSLQALGAVRDAKRSFRTFLEMTESRSLYSSQRMAVKEWLAQVSPIQE